ncbi:AQG_2a_G0023180.mRNA.1.CDS.1 [Saccharomyces cerevisiae]|uniref:Low-affinity methionine permease n=5 Tax=Saccharomyces TaxID=4930 RepID=MUP3_YEAST|nr:Mup3p [Saccharomyces cerevisiae S288C]P38734.1 RecName: Full=Low-affinity methionine permease [Saccharomyces cerevisiae S288C]AAB65048.1 unknown [Saccharomyces cerevisiae]AHY77660.1 Mup3p [Saccharomyces cerevisiae YJM993]AJU16256.1 Mup3p [Saccharomyces cerevisiae YJM1356]AJU16776.1 Mup3p [Saccharomyces cerevisiae YJM1383]AJU17030.1 Mup3p [Saccharomyces cerevisiae YJM1385]AJU17805.1 Mup3p [Saccharomyces cerevisiae YJM1388]AJU18059.1 Mup3p [Saccharomyces cerevisiae YJM1389]AJU18554.1 Mup3|eukprot:NP_011827.1 Mup3p [Saccharomyces cerevisiae S288C]
MEPLLFNSGKANPSQDVFIDVEVGDITTKYGSTNTGSFSSMDTVEAQAIKAETARFMEVPQGRHLGVFSTVVLFVSRIMGSGIFAVPSVILLNTGGNKLIYFAIWVFSAAIAFAGLYLFLEFGSWIPKSGGRKNFLERSFERPRLLISVVFSCYSVLTGYALTGSIVFGKYVLSAFGVTDDSWSKYVSISFIIFAVLIHGVSVRHGVFIQNALGGLKLIMIVLMCFAGLYTLFFYKSTGQVAWDLPVTQVEKDSLLSVSSIATAFISSFFCFSGWDTVHTVTSEIKNPVKTLKVSGPLSLIICFVCYTMMNVAYLKVLTYEEIVSAGPLVGSVLFTKLFGPRVGGKFIAFSIAISAASNILVVIYSISRVNQEIFKEGYLPFSIHMSKNWPFDAPLPSISLCGFITIAWILILPKEGESFNYLVSMDGYGNQFFLLLVAIGLFIWRFKHKNEVPEIRASTFGVLAIITLSLYMLMAPFFADPSLNRVGFLPPYQIMSLLVIVACFFFWLVKFVLLPKFFHYKLLPKITYLHDGLIVTEWVKKPCLC